MSSKSKDPLAGKVSSGVEELIKKLKDDGVQAGRSEAEKIIRTAPCPVMIDRP